MTFHIKFLTFLTHLQELARFFFFKCSKNEHILKSHKSKMNFFNIFFPPGLINFKRKGRLMLPARK